MHRAHDAGAVCRLDRWESICGREDAWMGRTLTSKAPKIGISAVRNLGGALAEVQAVLAAGLLGCRAAGCPCRKCGWREERGAPRMGLFCEIRRAFRSGVGSELLLHCSTAHALSRSPQRESSDQQPKRQAAHRTAPTRSLHFAQSSKYSFSLVAISCLSAARAFVSLGHHTLSAPPFRLLPAQVRSSFARHVGSSHERQGAV